MGESLRCRDSGAIERGNSLLQSQEAASEQRGLQLPRSVKRENLSWDKVGWLVALLVGVWGTMLGDGHFYIADVFLIVSATVSCVYLGQVTNILSANRRWIHFTIGIVILIALVVKILMWTRNQSHVAYDDSQNLKQLHLLPGLHQQIIALQGQNISTAAALQKRDDTIERLARVTFQQQQTIATSQHQDLTNQFAKTRFISFTKRNRFPVEIPYVLGERDRGIPFDTNSEDRLRSTYVMLEGIAEPPDESDEASVSAYLGQTLQYYILRSIFDSEHPVDTFDQDPKHGFTAHAETPVSVPDPQQFQDAEWDAQVKSLKLKYRWPDHPMRDGWLPKLLEVPSGSKVEASVSHDPVTKEISYVVAFDRNPEYSLNIKIEPSGLEKGTYPPNFVADDSHYARLFFVYDYTVTMVFSWAGDRDKGAEYDAWASGLFAGLHKRLAVEAAMH